MAKNQLYPSAQHIAVNTGKAHTSGAPVKVGQIAGVALRTTTAEEKATLWLDGSWLIEVDGALTVGQAVYIKTDGSLTATKDSNQAWGVALAAKGTGKANVEVAPLGFIPGA